MKVTRLPGTGLGSLSPRMRRVLRDIGILLVVFAAGYSLAFVLLSPSSIVTSDHVVPRVVDQPLEVARTELEKLNLRVKVDAQRPNAFVARGAVTSQDPPPGLTLGDGGTVSLVVSDGPAYVTVPDVSGMSLTLGSQILRLAGFRVGRVDSVLNRTEDPQVVITTRPAAGSARLPGETIDFIVTKAP